MAGTAPACHTSRMDSIAICAIFKNEARYLLEWIGYHRMVGIDHFVLYDNASTDGGAALIRSSPFARYVTLIDWPMQGGQVPAYGDFIHRHARRFTWAAFIDLDEYIQPLEAETIRPVLSRYDAFSGVLLHWLVFGPSGHETPPEGLTIASYLYRLPEQAQPNQHIKSLLRTRDLVDSHTTPHIMVSSGPMCNTRGIRVPAHALHDPPCHDAIVLNHYTTRSALDWQIKARRGRADDAPGSDRRFPIEAFEHLAAAAQVEDRRMVRFLPRLEWVMRDVKASPPALMASPENSPAKFAVKSG